MKKLGPIKLPAFTVPSFPLPRFSIHALHTPQLETPQTPKIKGLRIPGIARIRTSGMKPIFLGLLTVGIGSALALWLITSFTKPSSPIWPDAGAEYILPDSKIGRWLPPDPAEPERQSQTIQVNIAAGARIATLSFSDVSLGKTGLTTCFQVKRDGTTTGYLYVDAMTLTNISAPSFDMANSEAGILTLAGSADGRTNGSTLDDTISQQSMDSIRGAGSFSATNASADRVVINLLGSANVKTLSLTNVSCSVGGFDLDYIKAGTITQDATSMFGTGSGINSPDYVIQSSVKYRVATDSMVDTPITVR